MESQVIINIRDKKMTTARVVTMIMNKVIAMAKTMIIAMNKTMSMARVHCYDHDHDIKHFHNLNINEPISINQLFYCPVFFLPIGLCKS